MNLAVAVLCWLGLAHAQDERQILGEIESYDTQIAAISGQLDGMAAETAAAVAVHEAEAARAEKATTAITIRKDRTTALVRALYKIKRHGILRLLFGAEDAVELRRRAHYVLTVITRDEAQAREFADLAVARQEAVKKAEAAAQAAASLRAELEARRTTLESERMRRIGLLRDIHRKQPLALRALHERTDAQAAVSSSLTTTYTDSTPVVPAGDAASFRNQKGRLPRPVAGRLLRGFGAYLDPASGERTNNLGIDIAAAFGTPFRAVADGTVNRSGYVRGYGQVVMIQHGSYTTLYAHANGLRVAQGQNVRAGDVLGLVGNTGLTEDDAYRLHFEVRYNGTPQDPAEWLSQ